MIDSTTNKVVLNKAIRRVRFILGKSVALAAHDVALMDDGSVRIVAERRTGYASRIPVVTSKFNRADFRQIVERSRRFEADYVTEELPMMVRKRGRWVSSASADFGAYAVAVQIGDMERPTYFIVDAPTLADAYNVLTGLPFYLEILNGWEVETFPLLEGDSYMGIPESFHCFDMRREQYSPGHSG
ncbi:hypothetical protein [Streptomyces sp. NPDC051546]|uniref:hypothetical protein n=1 Tax=Streptomyces sp. NPDC051546 TaxID=3365655 RepID=UPI00378E7584